MKSNELSSFFQKRSISFNSKHLSLKSASNGEMLKGYELVFNPWIRSKPRVRRSRFRGFDRGLLNYKCQQKFLVICY